MTLVRMLSLGLVLLCPLAAFTQDDDDDELRPGLLATYRAGGVAILQIDRDVAVTTGNSAIDERFPAGPLSVVWDGQILLRTEEKYQFHAFVHGQVVVTVAGKEVFAGVTDGPQWISGPEMVLTFGEHPIQIAAAEVRGPLQLYWSADSFPLEPVPHHALFHAPEPKSIALAAHGRQLSQALRCAACHEEHGADEATRGPSLKTFGEGTSAEWLLTRLTRTTPDVHGRMPAFGFSNDDASAIAAYLRSVRQDVSLPSSPKLGNAKEIAAGTELVKSLGCLACHTWTGLGQTSIWSGSPLDDIAQRRQPAWVLQWLSEPTKINAHTRMPVFNLNDTERKQIVAVLMGETKPIKVDNGRSKEVTDDIVSRGKKLVEESRCAACHEIPGVGKPAVVQRGARNRKRGDGASGCLSAKVDIKKKQPGYRPDDIMAVTVYLDTAAQHDSSLNDFATGRDRLVQKNCTACHDRDGGRGLSGIVRNVVKSVPAWEGQAPTLVPPALTAVGDRMRDEPLATAIKGEQKPRMTWLKVRMPKFTHTKDEAAAIIAHLVGHDRIPENAPATPAYPIHEDIATADTQTLLAGRELAGGKGFSCVACHQLKDYQPPKVALGTRGSDLYQLGARLRPSYFFRWMRSPLRILPGVEMPGYQRPHPTLLDGQLDKQLAALWDALHDPNFTAPTNPAVVEQLWTLQPGDKPRVLRDVVTIPGEKGQPESIPRAIAIGFGNGHSILFDADTATVRMWTLGDFARQRTQGKSWFWDMAGSPLMQSRADDVDLALQLDIRYRGGIGPDVPLVAPKTRLERIEQDGRAVEVTYTVEWEVEKQTLRGTIRDRWSERPDGLEREISQVGLGPPSGWAIGVRPLRPDGLRPEARWAPAPRDKNYGQTIAIVLQEGFPPSRIFLEDKPVVFWYTTKLKNPAIVATPAPQPTISVEKVTAAPGFTGIRLPLPRTIMPTAMAVLPNGRLAFTSLKGHVFITRDDDDGDGLDDALTPFAEGLAAAFGILPHGDDFYVAHKPEVVALRDTDGDGRSDVMKVIATGWGYTDDYHDWTCGIVRDKEGWNYIGLGSDYTHKNRPASQSKWRGHILRFNDEGKVESIATGLRYPTGLALWDDDRLVCSDQQGVQNTFNELNVIVPGHRYGVPAKLDPPTEDPADVPAVQIPHPWTRSVNGVAVWPRSTGHPFAGQIVGAEYNSRFLIRCSLQDVEGTLQGAVYPLTKPGETNGVEEFLGPMGVTFGPQGELYVSSIHDSGWLGGLNTGDIVKLTPNESLPNGLKEVRVTPTGMSLEFVAAVDKAKAARPEAYKIVGYQRVWQGTYATEDTGRHTVEVRTATVSDDGKTVTVELHGRKTGHVYDIAVEPVGSGPSPALWPNQATYTLNRIPQP